MIWKTIENFPNYQISNTGEFMKLVNGTWYPWKLHARNNGYLGVYLMNKEGGVQRYVHQLVAEHFIGPRPAGNEVAHLDGNPQNNKVHNLKYVTHAENLQHSILHGSKAAKLKPQMVREIRKLVAHYTQQEIAEMFNVSQVCISRIIRGKSWGWLK